MTMFPSLFLWRAEGLRLRRQPLAWMALVSLLLVLLACATSAGLEARAWRATAAAQDAREAELLRSTIQRFQAMPPGQATATATYQLGRSELGNTRMAVGPGLGLGVKRLEALPHRLRASLDSRHVDASTATQLRNPLLAEGGLPDLPAIVALVLPLVALVLCAGLLQEEREQGRWGLLRVQLHASVGAWLVAALGWRCLALTAVAALGTLPALMLDPGASLAAALGWLAALTLFSLAWVLLGGLMNALPWSGATTLLASLGLWLLLTFGVPAGLLWLAQREAPMPSRLAAIVEIREAQQYGELREADLARRWYLAHPDVPPRLPAVWPASFVTRTLEQDRQLAPAMARFDLSRERQAALIGRWAWLSPGLTLVLRGQRLAGTDTASHLRYLRQVASFEARWRAFLVRPVMDGQGLDARSVAALPHF